MNKTFHDFLTNNSTFWDSHDAYPAAVQSIINDWFYYRECCVNNDAKFTRMFGRKLDVLEEQFKNMYAKYMAMNGFDPTVLEIMERTVNRVKNTEVGKVIERAIEENASNTRTLDTDVAKTGTEVTDTDATTTNALQDLRTLATSHTKTGTEDTDTTSTGTVGDSGTSSRDVQNSDYPMSSPTLGFENYVSTAQHNSETTSNTRTDNLAGTSDTTYNTTDADSGTVTDAHTGTVTEAADSTLTHNTNIAETGTITDAAEKTASNTENATETGEDTEEVTEGYTRKGNVMDMFEKYFELTKRMNAIAWLLDKLDVCFIQIFDEDEEETTSGGGGASSEEVAELEARVTALASTVDNLIAGDIGVYRIFNTYTEMIAANASIANGTTMFVKVDDRTPEAYHDSGAGTNTAQLKLEIPAFSGEYVTLNVTVNTNIERLSPQYNPELYTYINQFYELPEELTDIYDNYEIYNTYGSQVYPDYNFDASSSPYEANIGFSSQSNAPGTMSNSFWVKNANGNIVFDRYANAGV